MKNGESNFRIMVNVRCDGAHYFSKTEVVQLDTGECTTFLVVSAEDKMLHPNGIHVEKLEMILKNIHKK